MSLQFNLLDEPWIIVADSDDHLVKQSMVDVFRNITTLQRIEADDPMQTIALYRLLLAAMYGAFGKELESAEDWQRIREGFHDGSSQQTVVDYLNRYRDRFNLFDPVRPFYQVGDLSFSSKKKTVSLGKLVLTKPTNDRDFPLQQSNTVVPPDEAARCLVEVQAWDSTGMKAMVHGQPRLGDRSMGRVAWSGLFVNVLIEGANLMETLMLNFASQEAFAEMTEARWHDDKPVWERPQSDSSATEGYAMRKGSEKNLKLLHGPATLMTWQSRRIRLISDGNGMVSGAIVANGDRADPLEAWPMETMGAWTSTSTDGHTPMTTRVGQQLWRGITMLMPGGDQFSPVNLLWMHQLLDEGILDPDEMITLHGVGVTYGNQASVLDAVFDDRLDARLAVLVNGDQHVRERFEQTIIKANGYVRALSDFENDLANCRRKKPDPKTASKIRQILTPKRQAASWHLLDQPFRDMLASIPSPDRADDAIDQWDEFIHRLFTDQGQLVAIQAGTLSAKGRVDENGQLLNAGACLRLYQYRINKIRDNK